MRRRFQFSLRALLVATTLICAWLGYNVNLVRQRNVLRPRFPNHAHQCFDEPGTMPTGRERPLPWLRRLLGDYPVRVLFYMPAGDPDGSELRRVRSLFPETEIYGWPGADDNLPPGMERWPEDRWLMF